ncbi:MAG: hypothetical protein JSW55_08515 [Chloroflexota bacterium]|nr:MAG: hypothetical protein JSW55_08515 [Chloroflexota bacterium]
MANDSPGYVWPYPGVVHNIRITAIRTANDDGSEPATISPEDISTYIEKANDAFSRTGVHFLFDPCSDIIPGPESNDVLKSTLLNRDHASDLTLKTKTMMARNRFADKYPDSLVIFFRGGSDDINIHFSGWVGRVVVMGGVKDVDYMLAHEVGHYLHLVHTFGPNPQDWLLDLPDSRGEKQLSVTNQIMKQLAAGVPATKVLDVFDGDLSLVIDTPPDPRGTVFAKLYGSKCLGTLLVSEGKHDFVLAPDRSNLMSYYFDECGPQRLSQQQSLRVREAIEQGSRRRLSSLRASDGPIMIERAADALSHTQVNRISTVLINGMRIAVAARTKNGVLEVSTWRIGLGGAEVEKESTAQAGKISEVVAVHAGLGYFATIVRESHKRLKTIAWRVGPDGIITRLDDELGDRISQLAACRLDSGYFAVAGKDAHGDLMVSVWRIKADGTLQLRATEHAGAVSGVSIAYSNPVRDVKDKVDGFQFVTPVRDASGNLRTIVWLYKKKSITRLKTAVIGPTGRRIAASSPDLGQAFTANHSPNGKLALQSWRIGEYDGSITPVSQLVGQTADRIAMTALGPDLVVTAARSKGRGGGNLGLKLWKTVKPDLKIKAAASASAGAVRSISLCRIGPDLFVSAVADKQEHLKVIAWRAVEVPIDRVCVPVHTDTASVPGEMVTLGDVVRDDFIPLLEQISGAQIGRTKTIDDADRTIVVALADDPLLLQAPAEVQKHLDKLKASKRRAGHLFHCESTGAIWIAAKERRALRAAMFRYLHRLGCRWLAHHEAWTIIPKKKNLRVVASQVLEPRVDYLFYAGNTGLPYTDPPLPDGGMRQQALDIWAIRLGTPRELEPGAGHVGTAINRIHQCEFRADRRLMAWHDGGRGKGPSGAPFPMECFAGGHHSKPCYTNHGDGKGTYPLIPPYGNPWDDIQKPSAGCVPGSNECDGDLYPVESPENDSEVDSYPGVYSGFGGTIKIWAEFVRDELAVRLQKPDGQHHPNTRYVHADAADGGGDCTGDKCVALLREGPYEPFLTPAEKDEDSSPADRYFHLSNEVAKFIEYWFGLERGIMVLSYGERSRIPSIPIRPNMIVGLVPAAQSGKQINLNEKEYLEAWAQKRMKNAALGWGEFQLGVTKQWALANYVFDAPKVSPETVYRESHWAFESEIISFTIQSTYSSLTIGMHLLGLIEQIWRADDPDYRRHLCEWFALAFGPAAGPIRRMFDRWWDYFEWTQHEVGASCRDLVDAQRIADAAGVSAEIQTRIDHVKGYVWHMYLHERALDLRARYEVDPSAYEKALAAAMDDLLRHIWAVYPTFVLNSFRLYRNYFTWIPGGSIPKGTGIPTAEPGSPAEEWLFDKDAIGWQTVQPWTSKDLQGFMQTGAKAYPEIARRRNFSMDLVPWSSANKADPVDTTTFISSEKFVLYKGTSPVTIEMFTRSINNLPIHINVTDPAGVSHSEHFAGNPTNKWIDAYEEFTFSGANGIYEIEVVSNDAGSMQWRWRIPPDVPFSMLEPRNGTPGYAIDMDKHLYFFVPKGETNVVMSYNSKNKIQFWDSAGNIVPTNQLGQYQWTCSVPSGQDGKVWSFTGGVDQNNAVRIGFENCPRVIAWSAEQVLVPKELLEP